MPLSNNFIGQNLQRASRENTNDLVYSGQVKTLTVLDSVTLETIQKQYRKVRHYMFAYLEGIPGGSDLEKLVKDYKKAIKSHRRISEVQ